MVRRVVGGVVVALLVALTLAATADARITLRPRSHFDSFFFHAQYSTTPFNPADAFGIEIWNCSSGVMPIFIPDREAIVVCLDESGAEPTLADLVYAVEVPGGTCTDHGRSCFYRNGRVNDKTGGVAYLRILYSGHRHGNKVWLQSFGDLSSATQAKMLLIITINGHPRASLEDTFTPLLNGGWFSHF